MLIRLTGLFPEFRWVMPLLQAQETLEGSPVEPIDLFDLLEAERDTQGWDFALAITDKDLSEPLQAVRARRAFPGF